MRTVLTFVLPGLFAAIGSAAPACFGSEAPRQDFFSTHVDHLHHSQPYEAGGIIYLPPTRNPPSNEDLDTKMKNLIEKEMGIMVNAQDYSRELMAKVCSGYNACMLDVLSMPTIQVIPTKQISKDIICNTATCSVALEESVTVSTTHSVEVGVSMEAGFKPFGVGVTFTASVGYGFSKTKETSTSLTYTFNLDKGDSGYIGMVNAQISAKVRVTACKCQDGDGDCLNKCKSSPHFTQTGHHEVVVEKDGVPRAFVAFVHKDW
ncbi:hypothetical protein BGZ81_001750 [Podila clonocystis]|nr:hypothetical protein BGZ81_001750 [Podila clonocystis]